MNQEYKKKLKAAIAKLIPALPLNNGKFSADLRESAYHDVTNERSEYVGFLAGARGTYAMTDEERAAATISYDNTRECLVDGEGYVVNVPQRIYNVTKEGELIIENLAIVSFHHTSPTKGKAVICAGMIELKNGHITYIDTSSGHYRPENLDLYNAINTLKAKGSDVFAPECVVKQQGTGTQMLLDDFVRHMEEPTIAHNGQMMSRAEFARTQRENAHRAAKPVNCKLADLSSMELADIVLSSTLPEYRNDLKVSFNAMAEVFSSHEQAEYKTRIKHDARHELKSMTLNPQQLMKALCDRGATEAVDKMLVLGYYNNKAVAALIPQNKFLASRVQNYVANHPDDLDSYQKLLSAYSSTTSNAELANFLISDKRVLSIPADLNRNMALVYRDASTEKKEQFLDQILSLEDKPKLVNLLYKLSSAVKSAERINSLLFDTSLLKVTLKATMPNYVATQCINNPRSKANIETILWTNAKSEDTEYAIRHLSEIAMRSPATDKSARNIADKLLSSEFLDKTLQYHESYAVKAIYNKATDSARADMLETMIAQPTKYTDRVLCEIAVDQDAAGLKARENLLDDTRLGEVIDHIGVSIVSIYNIANKEQREKLEFALLASKNPLATMACNNIISYPSIDPESKTRLADKLFSEEKLPDVMQHIAFGSLPRIFDFCSPEVKERVVNDLHQLKNSGAQHLLKHFRNSSKDFATLEATVLSGRMRQSMNERHPQMLRVITSDTREMLR